MDGVWLKIRKGDRVMADHSLYIYHKKYFKVFNRFTHDAYDRFSADTRLYTRLNWYLWGGK